MPFSPWVRRDRATGVDAPDERCITFWDGGGDQVDWADDANWDNSSPENNCIAIINATDDDISNNLNQSTKNLERLTMWENWTGSITGTLQVSAGSIHYKKRAGIASINGTFRNVYVYETTAIDDSLTLSGTIDSLWVYGSAGEIVISNGTRVGQIILIPTGNNIIRLRVGSSVTEPAYWPSGIHLRAQGASYVTTASAFATWEITGGDVTVTGSAAPTNVKLDQGGIFRHKSSGAFSGTNVLYDGWLTLHENENATVTVNGWTVYGGVLDMRSGIIAGTGAVTYYGGILGFDEGEALTVS